MARKHSPGCYCCAGCQCGDVTPPQITIQNYTAAGPWLDVSDCCKQIIFNPDETQDTFCCYDLYEKTWTQECVRKGYIVTPIFPYSNAGCPPDPAVFCLPDPPLIHVATSTVNFFERQKARLDLTYRTPKIIVSFGRDTFVCNGENVCKWFLKIRVCYKYSVYINGHNGYSYSVTNVSLTPCVGVDEDLDIDIPYSFNFPCGPSFISAEAPEVCFERIKIFDELPDDGDFVFTNADDGSACQEFPSCASIDFDEEICFQDSFGTTCTTCWSDYTITNNEKIFQFPSKTITSVSGFSGCGTGEECLPTITNCNNNPTICPAREQTIPCQRVTFADFDPSCCFIFGNSGYCGVPIGFFDGGQVCPNFILGDDTLCNFFSNAVQNPFYAVHDCTLPGCDSTCCFHLDCNDCSICQAKIGPPYIWSQEITVETTCTDLRTGSYCCIPYPTTTLSVVFS